jgi:quercetin dioxygenase-like cupin family protein
MTFSIRLAVMAIGAGILLAQSGANPPVILNQKDAVWTPESSTPGADGALLREDPQSGGLELFVHYPAGHVFAPHWHSANERIILVEGMMSIQVGSMHKELQPGGYAFLPAKQVQTMSCGAASRCEFYVFWDGKLDNHKATEK